MVILLFPGLVISPAKIGHRELEPLILQSTFLKKSSGGLDTSS